VVHWCSRTRAVDGHRRAQTVHPRCSCVRVLCVCSALCPVDWTVCCLPFQLRQKGENGKERRTQHTDTQYAAKEGTREEHAGNRRSHLSDTPGRRVRRLQLGTPPLASRSGQRRRRHGLVRIMLPREQQQRTHTGNKTGKQRKMARV
jgi:hypothetical protein